MREERVDMVSSEAGAAIHQIPAFSVKWYGEGFVDRIWVPTQFNCFLMHFIHLLVTMQKYINAFRFYL